MNIIEATKQAFEGKSMPKVKIEIDMSDLDSLSSHDHRFKRWFDISPIRALILARLKGGHRKPITGNL